jgi:hypothetical protein
MMLLGKIIQRFNNHQKTQLSLKIKLLRIWLKKGKAQL